MPVDETDTDTSSDSEEDDEKEYSARTPLGRRPVSNSLAVVPAEEDDSDVFSDPEEDLDDNAPITTDRQAPSTSKPPSRLPLQEITNMSTNVTKHSGKRTREEIDKNSTNHDTEPTKRHKTHAIATS